MKKQRIEKTWEIWKQKREKKKEPLPVRHWKQHLENWSSDVSLEDSFRLYKEGMELLNECSQKIDRVEKKMLQMNEDGTFREF